MKILSREDLGILVQASTGPAVSMYMPTHTAGETEQDPIRLKNLVQEAEGQLVEYGLRAPDAHALLEPALQLVPDAHFWQHQSNGLAVFLSPDMFRYYRLPYQFPELVVVGERFHVKPLLPLFSEDGVFYVLAISQKRVRLLQCTRYHAREVTPEAAPVSLGEALKYDQPEKQQQLHTAGPGGLAISHGHGVSKDEDKVNILRYFQQVDRALGDVLAGEHSPLVIAAVDYLHGIYREANTYRYLFDEGIRGNPDDLSEETLQKQGWPVVQPYFESSRAEALEQYQEAISRGLATNDVKQALLAAQDGRVSTLFVATGVQQWGEFHPEARIIRLYRERRPGVTDLLDLAAATTLTRGGTVYALQPEEMPGETPVAALFRY